ncbi:transposase [Parafrankia sp. BMG5.11]|uniref:transposase n=1 Tax=Parafrankia sp. BMG5.11 TaxID=222540 RepID=UPI0027D2AE2B|nr:transposase [Parafrankia sp. BMG5.11]
MEPCPVRSQCTRATRNGRQLMLRPRDIHEAVEQARAKQNTDGWKQRYATRAGVESTIHQSVAVTGIRRCRYTGLPKTRLALWGARSRLGPVTWGDATMQSWRHDGQLCPCACSI